MLRRYEADDENPMDKWEPVDPQDADWDRLARRMKEELRVDEEERRSAVDRILRETLDQQ